VVGFPLHARVYPKTCGVRPALLARRTRKAADPGAAPDGGYPVASVSWSRRFSQAISEGDGISLIADVSSADEARAAENAGAEAMAVRGADTRALADATALPILWCTPGPLEAAQAAGADAVLLTLRDLDQDALDRHYAEALDAGLDCVVAVRDEDELERGLERLDPEVLLLRADGGDPDGLEHVLSLLPDVPAGKLAIAELDVRERDEVAELERAGVDGVIVAARRVADLLTAAPPAH
jgi:indole-3-glycerol phosphate synthase